jgi:hypothetical protein
LRNYVPYIAFGLLAVFAVSFMPFNALHHHAEDEHFASLYNQEIAASHHCELDDNLCDSELDHHCGHPFHLHKTIAKCFACEFHFIKHFESLAATHLLVKNKIVLSYQRFFSPALHKANIRLSNKGPPALV